MIFIDIEKAKEIAHTKRRNDRASEFAPLDIEATIPFLSTKAEEKRQVLREKYAEIQKEIDNAKTPEEIKLAANM
jgi:hypothetical protein